MSGGWIYPCLGESICVHTVFAIVCVRRTLRGSCVPLTSARSRCRSVVFWQSPTNNQPAAGLCTLCKSSETGPEAPPARLIIERVAIPISRAPIEARGYRAWSGQRGCGNWLRGHGGSGGNERSPLSFIRRHYGGTS